MSDDVNSTPVTRVPTADGPSDSYDHAISLLDTTVPDATVRSSSPNGKRLSRRPTRTSVKEQLARRKYAKWQETRFSSQADSVQNEEPASENVAAEAPQQEQAGASRAVDFASTEAAPDSTEPKARRKKERPYEIDILYENQRGSFFCGIPLYSHSSLLNFDPGPWVTKDFKDSAVNITNAQVPDPTWEWSWKTWYVDMSYDVDEEGWQYSFLFGNKFAWHGTHPWFHSFVRRRRWLRKRVRRDNYIGGGKAGTMAAAHSLTADYFTIHSKREHSPGSIVDTDSRKPPTIEEDEVRPEEVQDIATLLKALRLATIDREVIDLIKQFINKGGEELAYLGEYVPEITSFLVFQSSKRQLLVYLKQIANEAKQQAKNDEDKSRSEYLQTAVDSANKQISGLEYWSDRKHVLKTDEENGLEVPVINTIFDEPAPEQNADENPVEAIKGISSRAETGTDSEGIHKQSRKGDKGKEKEKVTTQESDQDEEVKAESPARLGPDTVFIPDDD